MKIFNTTDSLNNVVKIELPHSKSILNRVLIIESLLGHKIDLDIDLECNDVRVLYNALQSKEETLNLQDAGTPFRFLMAFYAVMGEKKTLQASTGLKNRPVKDLADVLKEHGCKVKYLENEGFPPLSIIGLANLKKEITINPKLSSQFVSALMLVVPIKNRETTIYLQETPSSMPYILLTANVMEHYGVKCIVSEKEIKISGQYSSIEKPYSLESDWTAASYFYALCVLTGASISFQKLKLNSSQGDKYVAQIFSSFGVRTTENGEGNIQISYDSKLFSPPARIDLKNHPDLAPTLIVLVACLKWDTTFVGLENLKIKESNRVLALKTELIKVGIHLIENDSVWRIEMEEVTIESVPAFDTHKDHRIAMSLSLLSVFGEIKIEDKEVVVKSFPYFWKELDKLGLDIE